MDGGKGVLTGNELFNWNLDDGGATKAVEKPQKTNKKDEASRITNDNTWAVAKNPTLGNESSLYELSGPGKSQAIRNLSRLVGDVKPSLVFVSETKMSLLEMQVVLSQFVDFMGVFMNNRSSGPGML